MERPKFLPREGDVVTLRAVVQHDFNDGDDYLFLKIGHHRFSVKLDDEPLVGFHSRAWKKGDAVVVPIRGHDDRPGTVVATHEDFVWIKFKDGSLQTHNSMDLEPDLRPQPRRRGRGWDEDVVEARPGHAVQEPSPATSEEGSSGSVSGTVLTGSAAEAEAEEWRRAVERPTPPAPPGPDEPKQSPKEEQF